jgi:hypothetical protein
MSVTRSEAEAAFEYIYKGWLSAVEKFTVVKQIMIIHAQVQDHSYPSLNALYNTLIPSLIDFNKKKLESKVNP